jgi:pimeloyl-ACP methyl ester carboxylesterase
VGDTNLRFHGAAPFRVAVIHGGPGAAGEMAPVARRLSRTRGVLEPMQTAQSVEGQVEELREALSRHAQVPAVLIGYSWGAWLSLLVAARYPELAGKLILVSCAPFAEAGAADLRTRRLEHLDDVEKAEYEAAMAGLGDPATPDSDRLLEKLGRLAAKADAYAPIGDADKPGDVRVSGEIYRAVWKEASEMRRSGALLREARLVRCPVVAIHGDSDSSPAAAVGEALSTGQSGGQSRLVVLSQCGHTPWLERYAKEEFYRVLLAEIG